MCASLRQFLHLFEIFHFFLIRELRRYTPSSIKGYTLLLLKLVLGGKLKHAKIQGDFEKLFKEIQGFIGSSEGLKIVDSSLSDYIIIEQKVDGHQLKFNRFDLEEILKRNDESGQAFLQVNFTSGKKVLLTDNLVGFRPLGLYGLDMEKLPKVVTTPDIQSVFEAIQESLQTNDGPDELEVLRKVFDSVICGGEAVGFDLTEERQLYARIPTQIISGAA